MIHRRAVTLVSLQFSKSSDFYNLIVLPLLRKGFPLILGLAVPGRTRPDSQKTFNPLTRRLQPRQFSHSP